jgi:hypothetical protein
MEFYLYVQTINASHYRREANKYDYITIIEARSAADANTKAIELGMWFGRNEARDCPRTECCHDRWSQVSSGQGTGVPAIQGLTVQAWIRQQEERGTCRFNDGEKIIVHYLNGNIEVYFKGTA